jgi:glycerol-3-phosphate dehydrogenase
MVLHSGGCCHQTVNPRECIAENQILKRIARH